MRKSILFVTNYPTRMSDLGGAAWVDSRLIAALSAAGATVTEFPVAVVPASRSGSVPLEVRSSKWRAAITVSRMLALRESYPAAKVRWHPAWAARGGDLVAAARRADVVIASQFNGGLLCADSLVDIDWHVAHNVDAVLARSHDPRTFRAVRNASRVHRDEMAFLRKARNVVTLSVSDAGRLRGAGVPAKPIALVAGRFTEPVTRGVRKRVGFIGKASWPPNASALNELTHVVLPQLRSRLGPETPKLVLAGRGTERYEGTDGVLALGRIDDLDQFYQQIDAVVIPRWGETTGISVKLAEAVSKGVAAICPADLAREASISDGVVPADSVGETVDALVSLYQGGNQRVCGIEATDALPIELFVEQVLRGKSSL